MSQAVVFLARGTDGGLGAAEAFFDSYRAHDAGLAHDLVIIAKGWDGVPGRDQLERYANILSARVVDLPDDGMDWGAYLRIIPLLSQDWLCFLNTHSRIQADGWLAALRSGAESAGVGAAGATGSWGTLIPALGHLLGLLKDMVEVRGLPRTILAAGYFLLTYPWVMASGIWQFPLFPNAHLRSNALLARRQLFADFAASRPAPHTKQDCHRLESGRHGFSRFLLAHGLSLVVVGRNGKSYPPNAWVESGTFRVPGQPNLLIEDNQTTAYLSSPRFSKRLMERAAWGRVFTL